MNRNHLKIIACISMLADHIGFFLFPSVIAFRWVGRLAMPLFAFFIGEGSIHTSNRKKYLLSVLLLGVVCQCFYVGEDIIQNGGITLKSDCLYFNILFTFALAIVGCYGIIDIKKDRADCNTRNARFGFVMLAFYTLCLFGLCFYFNFLQKTEGYSLYLDYGICGILLPMSVTLFYDRKKKLAAFSVMLIVYCLVFMGETPYVWVSLLDIPLLCLYNLKGGSKRFKYLFYVFYPLHFAIIYLIKEIITAKA